MEKSKQSNIVSTAQNSHSISFVPIADLERLPHPSSDLFITGIVTLIWPYSSSSARIAFLLAEKDFRLRNSKGQVRIQLRGAAARAVGPSNLRIGDSVVLSLEGFKWTDDSSHVLTPGRSVNGEMLFSNRINLQILKEQNIFTHIDVDEAESPDRSTITPHSLSSGAKTTTPLRSAKSDSWSFPAFSRQSPFQTPNLYKYAESLTADITGAEPSFVINREAKRPKIWLRNHDWTYISDHARSTEKIAEGSAAEHISSQQGSISDSNPSKSASHDLTTDVVFQRKAFQPQPYIVSTGISDKSLLSTPPNPALRAIPSPELPSISPFEASPPSSYFSRAHRPSGTSARTCMTQENHLGPPNVLQSQKLINDPVSPPQNASDRLQPQSDSVVPFKNRYLSKFEESNLRDATYNLVLTESEFAGEVCQPLESSGLDEPSTNRSNIDLRPTDPSRDHALEVRNSVKSCLSEATQPEFPDVAGENGSAEGVKTIRSPLKLKCPIQIQAKSSQDHDLIQTTQNIPAEASNSRQKLVSKDTLVLSHILQNDFTTNSLHEVLRHNASDISNNVKQNPNNLEQEQIGNVQLPTPAASQDQLQEDPRKSPQQSLHHLESYPYSLVTPNTSNLHLDGVDEADVNKSEGTTRKTFATGHQNLREVYTYELSAEVPEVVSPWFVSRHSQTRLQASEKSPILRASESNLAKMKSDLNTGPEIISQNHDKDSTREQTEAAVLNPDHVFVEKFLGSRTKLSYYPPLHEIVQWLNTPTSANRHGLDILAVVCDKPFPLARAQTGPKDYYITFPVSDPSIFPESIQIRIFRPIRGALPSPEVGDTMLLRGLTVASEKRLPMLISKDRDSGWLQWAAIAGTPLNATCERGEMRHIEFADEERIIANHLRDWWTEKT